MSMRAVLAHQGGWDEFGIPLLVVFLFFAAALRRRRHPRPSEPATREGCAYCGAALEPDAERCAACGFRVQGTLGPHPGGGGTDEG